MFGIEKYVSVYCRAFWPAEPASMLVQVATSLMALTWLAPASSLAPATAVLYVMFGKMEIAEMLTKVVWSAVTTRVF